MILHVHKYPILHLIVQININLAFHSLIPGGEKNAGGGLLEEFLIS